MARLVGVRANRVIAVAFAISGVLASIVSLYLVAQTGSVSYKMGVSMVLIAFVASVIGGMGSLTGRRARRLPGRHRLGVAAGLSAGGDAALPRRLRLPAVHRLPAVAARRACWCAAPTGSGSSHGAGAFVHRAQAVADRAVCCWSCSPLVVAGQPLHAAGAAAHRRRGADQADGGHRALCLRRQFRRVLLRPCRVHGDRRLCLGHPHHRRRQKRPWRSTCRHSWRRCSCRAAWRW